MSKIDTQGMSAPLSPEEAAKYNNKPQEFKPAIIKPRRLFTDTYAKELKILINEVLDEREGKTGVSYFDTEHFKYPVGEEEPIYKPFSDDSDDGLDYEPSYYQ